MEERKNIIYSATDLQRYHSGAMTEKEMHALEKASLEDPFLSDALQGYTFTETAEKDIIELKQRLAQKEEKKNIFLLFNNKNRAWLSAAAVLVLILGTVYLTLRLNSDKDEVMLAKSETLKQESSLEKRDSDIAVEEKQVPGQAWSDSLNAKLNQPAERALPGEPDAKDYIIVVPKPNGSRNEKAPVGFEEGHKAKESFDERSFAKTNTAEQAPVFADTKPIKKETQRDAAVDEAKLKDRTPLESDDLTRSKNIYRFSGKVIDDQGNPVLFANIKDSLGQTAVTTDAAGNFTTSASDSVVYATIGSVGYNTIKKGLISSVDQTIVLSRNTQDLDAVVVTAMGTRRQKSSLGYSTGKVKGRDITFAGNESSQPVTGMNKFWQYINDSIKRPQNMDGIFYKGPVMLSFLVKKNGTPHQVKTEKALCVPCDEEAKRLLLNGPKWKYVNKKRTMVTITF